MIDVWVTGPRPRNTSRIKSAASNASPSEDTPSFSVEAAVYRGGGEWGVRISLSTPSDLSAGTRDGLLTALENNLGGGISHVETLDA